MPDKGSLIMPGNNESSNRLLEAVAALLPRQESSTRDQLRFSAPEYEVLYLGYFRYHELL